MEQAAACHSALDTMALLQSCILVAIAAYNEHPLCAWTLPNPLMPSYRAWHRMHADCKPLLAGWLTASQIQSHVVLVLFSFTCLQCQVSEVRCNEAPSQNLNCTVKCQLMLENLAVPVGNNLQKQVARGTDPGTKHAGNGTSLTGLH